MENAPPAPARTGTVARTEILLVFGLCAFVAVAWAAEKLLGLAGPVHLSRFGPFPSLALSIIPAFLWLGYFYLQDRLEPEPKLYVFGVYVLGAFVAVPLSSFFQHAIPIDAPVWSGARLSPTRILLAIFPTGIAQELAKYLVVRYSVYLTDEFDEPMDGIIYMTAAGIGFATAQNFSYLASLDHTIFLGAGAVNCVVTTLAHGCIAGVLGYALGVARFTAAPMRRAIFLGVALVVAAVLNGMFDLLEELVEVSGMTVEPWRGVAFAAVFAGSVFAATWLLMRRHLAASPHQHGPGGAIGG